MNTTRRPLGSRDTKWIIKWCGIFAFLVFVVWIVSLIMGPQVPTLQSRYPIHNEIGTTGLIIVSIKSKEEDERRRRR